MIRPLVLLRARGVADIKTGIRNGLHIFSLSVLWVFLSFGSVPGGPPSRFRSFASAGCGAAAADEPYLFEVRVPAEEQVGVLFVQTGREGADVGDRLADVVGRLAG